ncbi:hypothetical protein JCM17823_18190 [Halorubrum gandharaense]
MERRTLIGLLGVGTLGAVAGCGDRTENGADGEETDNGNDGETPTPDTPTPDPTYDLSYVIDNRTEESETVTVRIASADDEVAHERKHKFGPDATPSDEVTVNRDAEWELTAEADDGHGDTHTVRTGEDDLNVEIYVRSGRIEIVQLQLD